MWSLIDTIGSVAIGGMILLLVISINLQMNSLSTEILENNLVQSRAASSTEIIKYDLYKIGYRVQGDKIGIADSIQILFYSDINNDSSIDTLDYQLVTPQFDSANVNPNKTLYRNLNGQGQKIIAYASQFKLTYYDSLGSMISYYSLLSQAYRNKIRSVKVEMTASSDYSVNDYYQATDWASIINPKNLK